MRPIQHGSSSHSHIPHRTPTILGAHLCAKMFHKPSEASTLWFLVITGSVQLACSLAVRMPGPICVVLCLPTEQESIADVGALVCSNLRIADGLSPIPWNAVFENFAEGCPVDYNCVTPLGGPIEDNPRGPHVGELAT